MYFEGGRLKLSGIKIDPNIEKSMPIMLSDTDAQCIIDLLEAKSPRSSLEEELLRDFKIFRYKWFSKIHVPDSGIIIP